METREFKKLGSESSFRTDVVVASNSSSFDQRDTQLSSRHDTLYGSAHFTQADNETSPGPYFHQHLTVLEE